MSSQWSASRRIRWSFSVLVAMLGLAVCALWAYPAWATGPATPVGPRFFLPQPEASPHPTEDARSKEYALGYVRPRIDLSHLQGRWPLARQAAALPSRWDWREQGIVTPVRNQAACGSCYAFATIGSLESQLLKLGEGLFDLSEHHAIACNYEQVAYGQTGCNGGHIWLVTNLYAIRGAVLESCDPYSPPGRACQTGCAYIKTATETWVLAGDSVPPVNTLKSWLYEYGPLYVALDAGQEQSWASEFSAYDGSYTFYHPVVSLLNHAVLLVGWDDALQHAGGTGAWIVKNSWGTRWGGAAGYGTERGYFTIAYGSAGMGSDAAFIQNWQDYDPAGELLYHDEAGMQSSRMIWGTLQPWGLARLTPTRDGCASQVEVWTADATNDVDVYIYDAFDGQAASGLLWQRENLSFAYPGYHRIRIDPPLRVSAGNDLAVKVKFGNASSGYALPVDDLGPSSANQSFVSASGRDNTWEDWGASRGMDLGIRLRVASACGAELTPTATPTADTITPQTPSPSHTATSTHTPTPTMTASPAPSGSAWLTIVEEGFEGSFPTGGWMVYDQATSGSSYTWGVRNCRAFAGTSSAWAVGGGADGALLQCGSPYPNNVETWMIYGPFSLAGASAVELTLKLWLKSESGYDYVYRGASVDGFMFYGLSNTGDSGGWVDQSLDLGNIPTLGSLLGEPNVWVALMFVSDQDVAAPEGAYVDNIVLRKRVADMADTPTATPSSSPTATPTPSPTCTRTPTCSAAPTHTTVPASPTATPTPTPTPTLTPSGVVSTTIEVRLMPGWNLVSLPLSPASTEIGDVLSSLEGYYDLVYAYDAGDELVPWKRYQADAPQFLNSLHRLDEQMGFWLRAYSEVTWVVTGSIPAATAISLKAGWNLVGYPGVTAKPIEEALAGVGGAYDLVYTYDAADVTHPWHVYRSDVPFLSTLQELSPGHGYWIRVETDCTWVMP